MRPCKGGTMFKPGDNSSGAPIHFARLLGGGDSRMETNCLPRSSTAAIRSKSPPATVLPGRPETVLFGPLPASSSLFIRRYSYFVVFLSACYFTLLEIVTFYSSPLHDVEEYFQSYLYGTAPEDRTLSVALIWLDWTLYNVCIAVTAFAACFFIVVCFLVRAKVQQLNRCFQEQGNSKTSADDLLALHHAHSKLFMVIRRLDDLYSRLFLVWYFDVLFNVAFIISTLVEGVAEVDVTEYGVLCLDVTYYVLHFVIVSIAASSIETHARRNLTNVYRMAAEVELENQDAHAQMAIMMVKYNASPMYLTGGGCFIVNRSLILTVVGLVFTYTAALLQWTSKNKR